MTNRKSGINACIAVVALNGVGYFKSAYPAAAPAPGEPMHLTCFARILISGLIYFPIENNSLRSAHSC